MKDISKRKVKKLDQITSIGIGEEQLNDTILTIKNDEMDQFTIYRYFTLDDIININVIVKMYPNYTESLLNRIERITKIYQKHDLIVITNDGPKLTSFSLNMIVDYVIRLGVIIDRTKNNGLIYKNFNLEYKTRIKKLMTDILNGYGTPYMCDIVAFQIGLPVCNSENQLNELGLNIYYSIFADYDHVKIEIIRKLFSENPENFIKFVSKMRFYWTEEEIKYKRIDLGLLVSFEKNDLLETIKKDGINYFRLNRDAQCAINMRGLGNRINYWNNENTNNGYLFLY